MGRENKPICDLSEVVASHNTPVYYQYLTSPRSFCPFLLSLPFRVVAQHDLRTGDGDAGIGLGGYNRLIVLKTNASIIKTTKRKVKTRPVIMKNSKTVVEK